MALILKKEERSGEMESFRFPFNGFNFTRVLFKFEEFIRAYVFNKIKRRIDGKATLAGANLKFSE